MFVCGRENETVCIPVFCMCERDVHVFVCVCVHTVCVFVCIYAQCFVFVLFFYISVRQQSPAQPAQLIKLLPHLKEVTFSSPPLSTGPANMWLMPEDRDAGRHPVCTVTHLMIMLSGGRKGGRLKLGQALYTIPCVFFPILLWNGIRKWWYNAHNTQQRSKRVEGEIRKTFATLHIFFLIFI